MTYYAGMDVSLEYSSVCVVDGAGKIMREQKIASEPSLPLWRPDRRVQQISGGTGHRPSRSDVPCRDDGSGQTARWVVATRPRVRRLVGLFLNGHPQVAASRRPRTEASARRSVDGGRWTLAQWLQASWAEVWLLGALASSGHTR